MRTAINVILLFMGLTCNAQVAQMFIGTGNSSATAAFYTSTLTINHSQCGSSNSTDFPVAVIITDARFKSVSNGGHVNDATNAYDIEFYSTAGDTTSLLKWAKEYYDPVSGSIVFHVKIPTVSSSTDVQFYIRYGMPWITTFQGGSLGQVYTNGYVAFYWMSEATGANLIDQTGNGNTGTPTNSPVQTTGQVDGSEAMTVAATNFYDLGTMTGMNGISKMTIAYWAKRTASTQMYLMRRSTSSNWDGVSLLNDDNAYLFLGTSAFAYQGAAVWAATNRNFNHVAYTFDGTQTGNSSRVKGYTNGGGTIVGFSGTMPATNSTSTNHLLIGKDALGPTYQDGVTDYIEISNVTRSADYILQVYNMTKTPTSFITLGTEGH